MSQVADGLLSDQQPPAPAGGAPPAAAVPRAAATPLPKAALPRQALAPGAKAGGAAAAQGVPQTPFVATRQARASAAVAQQLQERRQILPVMQVSLVQPKLATPGLMHGKPLCLQCCQPAAPAPVYVRTLLSQQNSDTSSVGPSHLLCTLPATAQHELAHCVPISICQIL